MPRVVNPTDVDLYCHVLRCVIPAGGERDATSEQADEIQGSTVFRVVARRGGKRVEVSGGPQRETR